jgi:hypothetical protein
VTEQQVRTGAISPFSTTAATRKEYLLTGGICTRGHPSAVPIWGDGPGVRVRPRRLEIVAMSSL